MNSAAYHHILYEIRLHISIVPLHNYRLTLNSINSKLFNHLRREHYYIIKVCTSKFHNCCHLTFLPKENLLAHILPTRYLNTTYQAARKTDWLTDWLTVPGIKYKLFSNIIYVIIKKGQLKDECAAWPIPSTSENPDDKKLQSHIFYPKTTDYCCYLFLIFLRYRRNIIHFY